jgi:hypothetical protein
MDLFARFESAARAKIAAALKDLRPVQKSLLDSYRSVLPGIPEDYLLFLGEYGEGVLRLGAYGDFSFFVGPVSAARDYYKELDFFSTSDFPAPRGEVLGFAVDEEGSLYGFDSGDEWRLVCVDGRRDVVRLELGFVDFVAGLIACHPQRPFRRVEGGWQDELGDFYSL